MASNACIAYITGQKFDRIALVRCCKTKEWMIPGGKIDYSDKTAFHGAKREFYEETKITLPFCRKMTKFIYNGHTAIYIAKNRTKLVGFQRTNETDKIHFAKIDDIFNGNFSRKNGRIKKYVFRSLQKMRINRLI